MNEKKTAKILNIMIVSIALCIIALSAVILLPMVKQQRTLDTSIPYHAGGAFSGTTRQVQKKDMQAKLFAEDLVVTEDGIANPQINITDDTEGNLLVNLETKETLYAANIYTRLYPASVTKLMTGIITMKYGNLDQVVQMEASDVNLEEGAQLSGLQPGDLLTMNQLLHILLVYSANDAGMAIARTIAGSEEAFVAMMNEEAKNLGMTGTHFMNPHGLHDPEHYTTVYDVYLMLNAAFSYPLFSQISSLGSYTAVYNHADGSQASSSWYATDQYLTGAHPTPEGVNLLGGKTGTTDQAGSCLSLVAQNRYGIPFISVVLYSYNHTTLYEDMDQLLNRIND
ncbi:MAG: D-alanyl-D-alanine carboxypeptidase [Lachnospiraceae bacterium]|nr:D-alanyl-D-alanine carboxypeptidase [Lachnospiraceae bacterium]